MKNTRMPIPVGKFTRPHLLYSCRRWRKQNGDNLMILMFGVVIIYFIIMIFKTIL
jgi:hypothetical protein